MSHDLHAQLVEVLATKPAAPGQHTGQSLYRLARDSNWVIEYTRRLHGISLRVERPDGQWAATFSQVGAFSAEEYVWEALAEGFNRDPGGFWTDPAA
jgi:hypothetical protein